MGWGVPAGGHNCPGRGCHWGAMSHTAPGTPPAGNSPTSGETVRSEPGYSAQPRQDTITLLCSHSAGDRPAQHEGTRRGQATALQGGLAHPHRNPFVLHHRHPAWHWASHSVSVTPGTVWGEQCHSLGTGGAGRGQSGAQRARTSSRGQHTSDCPTTDIHA